MAIYVPVIQNTVGGGTTADDPELMEVKGKSVTIETDDFTLEPSYVESITLEVSGDTEPQKDQCGHTEVKKNGDANWTITMEGIITDENLDELKFLGRMDVSAFLACDVHTGDVIAQDASINWKDDLSYIHVPTRGGIEQVGNAYRFQLQMKEEVTSDGPNAGTESSSSQPTFTGPIEVI